MQLMNKTNCYHYVKMCVGTHRKEQDMWNDFFSCVYTE